MKRLTVQAQVFEVAVGEVVLHDGHERGHLTEEQHFVVGGRALAGCGPAAQTYRRHGTNQVYKEPIQYTINHRKPNENERFHTFNVLRTPEQRLQ